MMTSGQVGLLSWKILRSYLSMPLRARMRKKKTLKPWCIQCHSERNQGTGLPQIFLLFSIFHSNESNFKLLPLPKGKEYLLCMGLLFNEIKNLFNHASYVISIIFFHFIYCLYIFLGAHPYTLYFITLAKCLNNEHKDKKKKTTGI